MRKLATVALSYSAAVFLAHYLLPRGVLFPAAGGLLLLFGLSFLLRARSRMRRRVALVSLSACAALFWCALYQSIFLDPAENLVGQTRTVAVRVVEFPKQGDGYSTVTARLTEKGLPGVTFTLYAYEGSYLPDVTPGDELEVSLRFASATVVANENTDSFTARGIFLRAYLQGSAEVTGRWTLAWTYFPQFLARTVNGAVLKAFPPDVAPLQKAMLTGAAAELNADQGLRSAISAAGVSHIVAIAGLQVSFLIGFVNTLVGGKQRRTALFGIPLILVYIAMTGGGPGAIRAGFMQVTLLIAPLLRRENDAATSLSASLMVLLLLNPNAAGSIGLQLSFAAVAGILVLTGRVADALHGKVKPKKKSAVILWRFTVSSFAATVGAVAFTAPLMALHFGSVSLIAPLTNLLVLSVVSLCFIAGYAVVIVQLIFAPLGAILGWILAWPLRYVIFAVKAMASVPNAALYTENNFIPIWLALTYGIFILCYLGKGERGFRPVLPVCLSVITLCTVLFFTELRLNSRAGTLTAVDVGQGEGVVLVSGRSTVVIDCGGNSMAPGNVASCLLAQGRHRVDLLILTHLHKDHAGGVAALMAQVRVDAICMPADDPDTDGVLPGILDMAARSGTVIYFLSGDSDLDSPTVHIAAYKPPLNLSANENGVVLDIRVGSFEAMVMGDAGSDTEDELLAEGKLGDIDLLVVGHHGSKYSTSEEFLAATRPKAVFISVGYNTYGHPTPETLSRLADAGAEIFRTDLGGNLEADIH
ncbi:MAG: DNA internalization-related competence protein ComEC/Rec2 [Firmicutes bacterium]|nr:DNA internalization-related competence protein ComEC/Rec2 [Bacillota bacterium]